MPLLLILLICGVADQPGPLDAYLANYSLIKAECEYTYVGGQLGDAALDESQVWRKGGIAVIEDRRMHIDGRWSCDGSAECVLNRPDQEIASGQLKSITDSGKPSGVINFAPRIELLTDGRRLAYTDMQRKVIHLEYTPGTPQLVWGKTPLFRWEGEDLPSMLRRDYPGTARSRIKAVRGGRPLEVEVYRRGTNGGWRQTEIGYDSTVGFLPRFCRDIYFSKDRNSIYVYEKYLVDVGHCKAGGFVPLVWYDFVLDMRGLDVDDRAYTPCMSLHPSKVLHAGRFKVSRFSDHASPAALEDLGAARVIAASVDRFVTRKSFPPRLTLDQIEAILNADMGTSRSSGGKFKPVAGVAQDHIDREELNEVKDEPRSYGALAFVAAAIGVVAAATVAVRRKWRGSGLCILLLMVAAGCRKAEPPTIKLQAGLKDDQVIIDPRETKFTSYLKLLTQGTARPASFRSTAGAVAAR